VWARVLRTRHAKENVAVTAALATALYATALNGGGFNHPSRALFVAFAGLALLVAATVDVAAVLAGARTLIPMTLGALAILSLVSAVWTVGSPAGAVRSGLVIAGYGAIYVVASVLAARAGSWPLAALLGGLGVIEAVLALHAVATHTLPDAELLGSTWRPGGTFEYPPALAILEVGALPVFSSTMIRDSRVLAGGAAAAATLAGAVLGLSAGRLGIGLAVLTLGALALRPRSSRQQRTAAIATCALVAFGALIASSILETHVGRVTAGTGAANTLALLAIALALGVAWLATRGATAKRNSWSTGLVVGAIVLVVLAGAAVALRLARTAPAHHQPHASKHGSDLLHGRLHEWDAALQTWLSRPLLGGGASSYHVASRRYQGRSFSIYAHDLPLELAAELGIAGFLLALLLYAGAVRMVLKVRREPVFWLLAPIVIAFLVSNLVDWTWHLAGLSAVWAAGVGTLRRLPPEV
jgi:hypothetical protein